MPSALCRCLRPADGPAAARRGAERGQGPQRRRLPGSHCAPAVLRSFLVSPLLTVLFFLDRLQIEVLSSLLLLLWLLWSIYQNGSIYTYVYILSLSQVLEKKKYCIVIF